MKRICAILICFCLFTLILTPQQFAQKDTEVKDIQSRSAVSEESQNIIPVTVEEMQRLSEDRVISAIVEGSNAYAIGFINNKLFKTAVAEGVSEAYGVSKGMLACAKPMTDTGGNGLFLVDLRTNEQQSLFPGQSVLQAEWQPGGTSLAAIVRTGSKVSLKLYALMNGTSEMVKSEFINPDFLRWSDDGQTLYFVQEDETQQEFHLVRRTAYGETRVQIQVSDIPFLSAVKEPVLQSYELNLKDGFSAEAENDFVVQHEQDGSSVLKLKNGKQEIQTVKQAFPIRLIDGGLLFQSTNTDGAGIFVWRFESGEIFQIKTQSAQVAPQAEEGIVGAWYLSFPMSGVNSASVPINAIMDHTMATPYVRDDRCVAYTGETGTRSIGVHCFTTNSCGYAKTNPPTPFTVNGNYVGGGETRYLYYDAHPGYDFRGSGDIVAPADGDLFVPAKNTDYIYSTPSCYNIFAIDHRNGYVTWYLHASSYISPRAVRRGEVVGTIGSSSCSGTIGTHLHFEVRKGGRYGTAVDPYGWAGGCQDPYTSAANVNLWTNSGTRWEFNQIGNTQGWAPKNVECFSVNSDKLFIDPKASDPYIEGPPLVNVNASSFNTVELNLASNAPDGTGSIYFTTASSPNWDGNKRVDFTVNNNGQFQPYSVRMDGNGLWSGAITAIRIDPSGTGRAGTGSDTVGFEYIRLANTTGGGTPVISVTPSSQSYGSVPVGSFADRNFTVQNAGSGTLTGSASVASPFSIVSGSSYNLGAGQSQTVTVRFTPTAAQSYSQNVSFTGGGGASRGVSGTGTSSCSYSISPGSQSFTANGGSGSVSVNAPGGCTWSAFNNVSWITITSGSSGSGNGTVFYQVAANSSSSARSGTLTIAGQTFTVSQAGASSTPQPAQMTSPPPGSTFSGSSVNFAWTAGSGVSQYYLYIGNFPGDNSIYEANMGTSLSTTVNVIPTDGRQIYVRLWSFINGNWYSNDYPYTAASGSSGTTNRLVNPGFESGASGWVQFSSAGFSIITTSASPRSGSWLAWLGGGQNLTEYIYQDVNIPANATQVNLQFWYKILTEETGSTCFDSMAVEIRRASDGVLLSTPVRLCNTNQTQNWTQSSSINLLNFRGQRIRLVFVATTDSSLPTSFYLDDLSLMSNGN